MDLRSFLQDAILFLREVESTLLWVKEEVAEGLPIDPSVQPTGRPSSSSPVLPETQTHLRPFEPSPRPPSLEEKASMVSQLQSFHNTFNSLPSFSPSLASVTPVTSELPTPLRDVMPSLVASLLSLEGTTPSPRDALPDPLGSSNQPRSIDEPPSEESKTKEPSGYWNPPDRGTRYSSKKYDPKSLEISFSPARHRTKELLQGVSHVSLRPNQRSFYPEAVLLETTDLHDIFPLPDASQARRFFEPLNLSLSPPLAGSDLAEADAKLHRLNEAFRPCPLCQGSPCRHWTFGRGPARSRLLILIDGPVKEKEEKQGQPLSGPPLILLTQMLAALGLRIEDAYLTNLVKCRFPLLKRPQEIEGLFLDLLFTQIGIIQPDVILLLGASLCRHLLPSSIPLQAQRGKWFEIGQRLFFATFSPIFLLQNPLEKSKAWQDLQQIAAWFLRHPPPPF